MAVTPIRKPELRTPIFKSADPYFNHEAAQAAYELVMKMSDDEARIFTEIVVADTVEYIIEKNLRTVQRRLDEVIAKRTQDVKKALVRKAAEDPEGVLPYAQALAVISKASPNPYDYGYRFQESDFNRDPSSGRFRTKVTHTQKKPINEKTATSLGIKKPPTSLPKERVAQYQDEYRQLAQFLGAVHESAAEPGSVKVALTYEDAQGRRSTEVVEGTKVPKEKLGQEDRLIGIQASPGALTAGGAAFGLTQALGRKGTETINNLDNMDYTRTFANDWTRQTDGRNSNERTYNRIAAGSKYLGQVAPYSPKAQMAASFGEFVGNMGPEAEKVIGPTARKTAYRYRGTERTPDKKLVSTYSRAISQAKSQTSGDPYRNTPEGRRANLKSPQDLAPSQMAAARVANDHRAPSWDERELGRRAIVEYFMGDGKGSKGKIPSRELYGLQLASGNTPPSEGVLLNKDGQIVTQAVGYGDDHYLPFDLKNLKHLKGGEYIRTRSVGGLTSEDIYAGLMAGARQVTVVSRSGTFTLTFDEDLRGGRRHNDKARRMTRRYEQILDAVQSEKVDRGQVRPEIREIIENQVRSEMEGFASARDIRTTIRQRIEEYKEDPELAPEDEELINAMSRAALRDGTTRDEKEYKRQVTGKIMAEKQTRYRLDGHGYEAALKALEEQFPYYIKVRSVPMDAQDIQNLELDRGYVEPGLNRPTAAAAGLFGATHGTQFAGQGGKFSASEANYQRARTGTRAPAPKAEEKAEGEQKAEGGQPAGRKAIRAEQMAAYIPAVGELQAVITRRIDDSEFDYRQKALLNASPDEIAGDPVKQDSFNRLVDRIEEALVRANKEPLGEPLTRYRKAIGDFNRLEWDPGRASFAGAMPFAFRGKAYESNDPGAKHAEETRLLSVMPTSVASTKKLSDMSDDELKGEITRLSEVRVALSAAGVEGKGSDVAIARARALKQHIDPNSPAAKKLIASNDPVATIAEYQKALHQMRALYYGTSRTKQPATQHTTAQQAQRNQQQNLRQAKGSEYEIALLRYAANQVRQRPDAKSQDRADGVEHIANKLEQAKSAAEYDVLREDARVVIEGADRTYREKFLPIWQQQGQVKRGGSNPTSILNY